MGISKETIRSTSDLNSFKTSYFIPEVSSASFWDSDLLKKICRSSATCENDVLASAIKKFKNVLLSWEDLELYWTETIIRTNQKYFIKKLELEDASIYLLTVNMELVGQGHTLNTSSVISDDFDEDDDLNSLPVSHDSFSPPLNVSRLISMNRSRFTIGIMLNLSMCLNNNFGTLLNVSFVVFNDDKFSYFETEEEAFDRNIRDFKTCQQIMEKYVNSGSLQFAFRPSWSSPDVFGIENKTAFHWYWETMGNWSLDESTFIVMGYKDGPSGWWNFTQAESVWTESPQYKNCAPTDPNTLSMSLLGLDHDVLVSFPNANYDLYKDQFEFDRRNFAIVYDGEILEENVHKTKVTKFLNLIWSRFSKVWIPLPLGEQMPHAKVLPLIAAELNKNAEECLNPQIEPLEISILEDFKNFNVSQSKLEFDAILTSLKTALNWAHRSNQIFPGTVQQIIISLKPLTKLNVQDARDYLNAAANLIKGESLGFGVVFTNNICKFGDDSRTLQFIKRDVLKVTSLIYVKHTASSSAYSLGKKRLDLLVEDIFNNHEGCINRLQILDGDNNRQLNVGLYFEYKTGRVLSHSKVSDLWRYMDKMAEERNVSIVAGPSISLGSKHWGGWWRLTTDDFENYLVQEFKMPTSVQLQPVTSFWAGIIFTMALVFIGICTVFGIIFWRYQKRMSSVMLSNKEITEFFKGPRAKATFTTTSSNLVCGKSPFPNIVFQSYDQNLEIPLSMFKIGK